MKISAESREFLTAIFHAAFANPFREVGSAAPMSLVRFQNMSASQLQEFLSELFNILRNEPRIQATRKLTTISDDNHLLRLGWIFGIYFKNRKFIDEHIEEQLTNAKIAKVKFADALLLDLAEAGFESNESIRLVSVFFQLRRAHCFISRRIGGNSAPMCELRSRMWENLFTSNPELYFSWSSNQQCHVSITPLRRPQNA